MTEDRCQSHRPGLSESLRAGDAGTNGTRLDTLSGRVRRLGAERSQVQILPPDQMRRDHPEFEVVLRPEQGGGFSVSVPALPGCHTQGETREEALAIAEDAIEGYLEVLAGSACR